MNDTATQAMASPTAKDLLFEAKAKIVPRSKNAVMDAFEDVVFGSAAGIAGKFIEYPFDTVKVRLQSQSDRQPLRYKGPLDCFRQSIRSDGFLGLYRGISAPLVGAALETSSLFVFEQLAQKAFFSYGLYNSDKPLPLSALYLTGAISGAFTSLVLTPVELVKCKMQVPAVTTSDGMIARRPTPLSIIRQVYRYQGIRGFWNGQLGTLIRETGGCAAWFGSKETVTMLFRKLNEVKKMTDSTAYSHTQTAPLPIWQQAVAGAAAGVTYNFVFFPADTIKSRMQTATIESMAAPITFWKESKNLWQQYGIKGFYRGCGITVLRAAPSSAFIFIIYDGLKRHFHLS